MLKCSHADEQCTPKTRSVDIARSVCDKPNYRFRSVTVTRWAPHISMHSKYWVLYSFIIIHASQCGRAIVHKFNVNRSAISGWKDFFDDRAHQCHVHNSNRNRIICIVHQATLGRKIKIRIAIPPSEHVSLARQNHNEKKTKQYKLLLNRNYSAFRSFSRRSCKCAVLWKFTFIIFIKINSK